MDYLADMGIVHCADCGRLFRPRSGEDRCAGCQTPRVRLSVDDEHTPVTDTLQDAGGIQGPEKGAEAPVLSTGKLCSRCHKRSALKNARYCPECRIELEQALRAAAGDVFDRVRAVNGRQAHSFHVHEALESRRSAGGTHNYSGAKRLKY